MDLKYCCDYKLSLAIGVLAFLFCISCSSSKEARALEETEEDPPQILQESGEQTDSTRDESAKEVVLNYENESTSVTIPIDPQQQDFILELEGLDRGNGDAESDDTEAAEEEQEKDDAEQEQKTDSARPDSTVKQDSLAQANSAEQIKQVMKYFRRAQDLFYRQEYESALEMVNRSLETQPTADALGLKGTIFFMQDNMTSARYYWNRAVEMDPEIPVPDIPELDSIIEDIKATEDQEEEVE